MKQVVEQVQIGEERNRRFGLLLFISWSRMPLRDLAHTTPQSIFVLTPIRQTRQVRQRKTAIENRDPQLKVGTFHRS